MTATICMLASQLAAETLQMSCSLQSRSLCIKESGCEDVSSQYRLERLKWVFRLDRGEMRGVAQRCEGQDCAAAFPVETSPLAFRLWERLGNESFAISPDMSQYTHTVTNSANDGGRVLYGFGTCTRE